MKKRILSLIFAVVLIFGSICTPFLASAADDSTDYLLEEMKTNMPEFDPAKYVASSKGSPMIIGSTLYESYHEQLGSWQGTTFSLYIFNPRQLDITSALAKFFIECWDDDEIFDADLGSYELLFYRDDYSKDKLFYKLTFDLTYALQNTRYSPEKYTVLAMVDSTDLYYKNGDSTKTWTLDQSFQSVFQPQAEGGYNVKTRSTDLEQLDVNLTSYKIGTVNTDLTRQYEVFTAYFAIPEDYIKYYENLYSVTANYEYKHTTPILWGNDSSISRSDLYKSAYSNSLYFISDKISHSGGKFNASTIVNLTEGSNLEADNCFNTPFYWWFYIEEGALGEVSQAQLKERIIELGDYSNNRLFDDWEIISNTKTIDDTFDTFSYYQNAEYEDYWKDFGSGYTFLLWLSNNPEVLYYAFPGVLPWLAIPYIQEYIDETVALPDNYTDYLDDCQNIFIFNEDERAKLNTLSNEEISSRYLVDLADVPAFKEYVNANPYTVLYRYDVGVNYSDSLARISVSSMDNLPDIGENEEIATYKDYSYGISSYNMYFNFEVIDITFKLEDEYLSVATKSEKKNFIPSAGVTVFPSVEVPSVDDLFGGILDKFDDAFSSGKFTDDMSSFLNTLGEKLGNVLADFTEILGNGILGTLNGFGDRLFGAAWGVVKPVLIIIGLALVIFLLWWVIKSVTGKNFFDVLFAGKNIRLKASELAIRSSDSENRRREADQNAKLREQELALKSIDQANRKAEADADAKARKRDQDMKVQENIAKREKDEREAKLKERESDRYERELKIREAEEKRRARDDRRRQAELREKDKADKKKKLDEMNPMPNHSGWRVEDAMMAASDRTYNNKK